jgi:membrane fusion protein (multidrug efflux system)
MSDKGTRDELKTPLSGAAPAATVARLCYVDDSRTSAYVVQRMLRPFGYQVDYFPSAEPAFVALIQEDYDLLLTDLKVSSKGMDGDDLIRTLRQSGHPKISTMPVIVITGSTDKEVLRGVYDAGANHIMNKPVNADDLDRHIRDLLFAGDAAEQPAKDSVVVPLHAANRGAETAEQPLQPQTAIPEARAEETAGEDFTVPVLNETPMPEITLDQDEPIIPSMSATDEPEPSLAREQVREPQEPHQPEPVTTAQPPQENLAAEPLRDEVAEEPVAAAHEEPPVPEAGLSQQATDETSAAEAEEMVIDSEQRSPGEDKDTLDSDFGEQENILREMEQHALVVRERPQGFADSNLATALYSLVELLGMRSLIVRAFLVGVLITLGLAGWNVYFDRGVPVETTFVESGEIYQSITVPGRIVSKQRVNVSPARTGRVVELLVKEGDQVKKGQVLARLDDRELLSRLNRAKANLTSAREGIVLAERNLDRLRRAHSKGAVARRFVEDAEVDLRTARAQAGVAVEEVHSATLSLDSQKIKAAFSGTVTARYTEIGQWVSPSETLFTLVDETQREIEVHVDAADSVLIDVGQVVAVSSDAFPGLEWHETVTRLGTATDNERNSNSVKVYISLGNDAPELRFGQQVDADIRTAWNPNTLKVPFEALISRNGQTLVAVLENGRVVLKPVETGIEDFSMAEIKQGLHEGEMVILTKGQILQNGDKVYPARNSG